MLTMFTLEKLLESINIKPKIAPTRKLQRSPKIMGYEREDDLEIPLDLKEPLLLYSSQEKIDCDEGKFIEEVNDKKNSSVRVKVLLTKEEAAKLLAKCKEEGVLDFKDVVKELVKLPAQRINIVPVSTTAITPSKDLELTTISEEEEEEEEYDEFYSKKNR